MCLDQVAEAQVPVENRKVVQIVKYYEELLTFQLIASELQEFAFCVNFWFFAKIIIQVYLDVGLFRLGRVLLLHLRF